MAVAAGCTTARRGTPPSVGVSAEGASSGGSTGSALMMNSINPAEPGGDDAGAR